MTAAALIELVPLGMIRPHPSNPRIHATADEALVESIRSVGLIDPLLCVPDPENPDGGVLVVDGHRRFDGCTKAGLAAAPCRVRDDLVTEAQQIEVMAITGLQKESLSPVEEAQAYEQLALLGMDEAAIAAATGFSQRRVKARRRLTSLSKETRAKVHEGQATLTDVEALMEFADDPEITAQLEEKLGTSNFQHTVHAARGRRDRLARQDELMAEHLAAGAIEVEGVPGAPGMVIKVGDKKRVELPATGMHMFPEVLRAADHHSGCLAVQRPWSEWSDPLLLCIDAKRHGGAIKPATPVVDQSEWEKKRAEREARAARFAAASDARRDWIRTHITGLIPARGNKPLADLAGVLLPLRWDDVDPDLAGMSTTKVLDAFAGWLTYEIAECALDRETQWVHSSEDALQLLAAWDWLTGAGYQLSDVDREQRTLLETRLVELTEGDEG